jgi:hypothetical protein
VLLRRKRIRSYGTKHPVFFKDIPIHRSRYYQRENLTMVYYFAAQGVPGSKIPFA